MGNGDSGATMHSEFNKHVFKYTANYTNPLTSGAIQDQFRDIDDDSLKDNQQCKNT